MVVCPAFLVAILISYRDVFRKEARIDDHAPLARISIYLMISFTYVVYPFSVWTLSVKIYQYAAMSADQASQSLQILVVFASCLLILVGGCVVLFGLQMRNTVWTKFALSSTPSVSETFAYFTVVAIQVVRPAVATADKSALTLAFQIITSVALLLNVYNLHARLPFWHIQTNLLYLMLFACVVAFKITIEIADGSAKTNKTALICFAVVQLVARVVPNVILHTSKVRVFEKNMTGFKRQLGITLLQKYLL